MERKGPNAMTSTPQPADKPPVEEAFKRYVRPDQYAELPQSLRAGMENYIERHIKPGDFLGAVMQNNLLLAFKHADVQNKPRLGDIVNWGFWNAPAGCWGSKELYESWLKR